MFEQLIAVTGFALQVVIASLYLAAALLATALSWVVELTLDLIRFLFSNWIVQALFAAWVAFELQQKHRDNANKIRRLEKQYDQKIQVVGELFSLVDKRIAATGRYRDALGIRGDDWVAERRDYREVVKEWNDRATNLVVTMITLLPARYCNKFDREIFYRFSELDRILGQQRKSRQINGDINLEYMRVIDDLLDEISELSHDLMTELLNHAREDRRRIERKPRILPEFHEELRYGFLVKSLFSPRMEH